MKTFKDVLSEAKAKVPFEQVESELVSFFKKDRNAEVRKEKSFQPLSGRNVSARYWGKWEVPEGEEDDGDYDWEVLTKKSRDELRKFMDSLSKKYKKDYVFYYSTEEKNWISVDILKK